MSTNTTAFRWRHRWLRAPCTQKETAFTGIVEAEETFFLESYKGSRAWARHAQDPSSPPPPARKLRKRGGKAAKRGLSEEQIAVIMVRDRHGATTDTVLSDLTRKSVTAVLKPLLNRNTLSFVPVLTDAAPSEALLPGVINAATGAASLSRRWTSSPARSVPNG